MVTNIHTRTVAGSVEAAGALLDALASPDDRLWPSQSWPTLRFDRPLGVGAVGGHGPIRYTVASYTPGRDVTFRFDPRIGLVGTHRFTVASRPGGRVEIRHTLVGQPTRAMRLGWPLVFAPLHDALVEDALDNAERELTGSLARSNAWSRRVRLLRALVARTQRQQVSKNAELLPNAEFGNSRQRPVAAPPEVVRQAVLELRTEDLRFATVLMTVRTLPARLLRGSEKSRPEKSRLGERRSEVPEPARFIDRFTSMGFVLLADEPRLLAVGAAARFWQLRPTRAELADPADFAAFDEPGWAKAVTSLEISPADGGRGSVLATTTSVAATDEAARRAFRRYWALIRMPSGLIRREWLAAIARRAEAAAAAAN